MKSVEIFGPDKYDRDCDSEDILYEMSNFPSHITGLPENIQLWVRTDLSTHRHNRYRVKIRKNKQWAGVYLVGQFPEKIADGNVQLTTNEDNEIKKFINKFSTLIISLIDEKIDTATFGYELIKIRGENL